jgi:spermidine/putrescine transport system substrate-binding protein
MDRSTRRPPAFPFPVPDLSRRGFIRGATVGGVGLSLPALLAACGTEGSQVTTEECKSTDKSDSEKVLNFSNWPEYIDVAGKRMPTLEAFEKKTGIQVNYNTDVNDNTEFFAKVQNQLGACEPVGRDIFVLTDWMAARMIDLGWIQELDHGNLPDVDANLVPNLQDVAWDKGRTHSVPWQSGFTGIAYNSKYTGEIGSFEELLTNSEIKGQISLLTEMRDTMGFMLKIVGADPSEFTDDEWGQAIEELEKAVGSGQVRRFTGNDYVDDLNKGDLVACEAWSGDVIAMQYDNPDIKWVVPEEGLSLWSDNMMVPNKADHKANAEALMNYYYDPAVAAELAAWVNYICPVAGAKEAMEKIDPSLVDAPLIFPDDEFMAQSFGFMALDEETARKYETEFSQAIG